MPQKDSLLNLKKAIAEGQLAQNKWNNLMQQRDALEQTIAQLQEEVSGSFFTYGRRQHLEKNKEMLQQLQQKLNEVDHLLDQIEHINPEYIADLEQQLTKNILELFPQEYTFYAELSSAQALAEQYNQELQEACQICAQMKHPLEEIEKVLHTVRRRWILSYMFGANPNARIVHLLAESHQTAQSALKALSNHRIHTLDFQTPAKGLYKDLIALLQRLEIETKRHWNFKTARLLCSTILHELTALENLFTQELQASQRTKQALENKRNAWIDRLIS